MNVPSELAVNWEPRKTMSVTTILANLTKTEHNKHDQTDYSGEVQWTEIWVHWKARPNEGDGGDHDETEEEEEEERGT